MKNNWTAIATSQFDIVFIGFLCLKQAEFDKNWTCKLVAFMLFYWYYALFLLVNSCFIFKHYKKFKVRKFQYVHYTMETKFKHHTDFH